MENANLTRSRCILTDRLQLDGAVTPHFKKRGRLYITVVLRINKTIPVLMSDWETCAAAYVMVNNRLVEYSC